MAKITKKQEFDELSKFGCAFLQTNSYGGYCIVIDDGGEFVLWRDCTSRNDIMAQNITISRTADTRALLTALFAVIVLLVTRMAKNTLEAIKTVRQWLRAQHSFYGQDGDPIQCTGWQFIGYNIMAAVVAILLCIKY